MGAQGVKGLEIPLVYGNLALHEFSWICILHTHHLPKWEWDQGGLQVWTHRDCHGLALIERLAAPSRLGPPNQMGSHRAQGSVGKDAQGSSVYKVKQKNTKPKPGTPCMYVSSGTFL